MPDNDVLFETLTDKKGGCLGKIILNRPRALNALSGDMFAELEQRLTAWHTDSSVKAVLIRSHCDKAFCAGGDIRAIYEAKAEPTEIVAQYFRHEYHINRLVHHFKKPYIALTNGVTMGGGVGLSLHGSHCVASPDLRWAMPETSIGFFPDVGSTYYLSRLKNYIGFYLALTGNIISAEDAFHLRLSPYIVVKEKFDVLEKKLVETPFLETDHDVVTNIITSLSEKIVVNKIKWQREEINRCFCFKTIEEIFSALEKEGTNFSEETVAQLKKRSPTSLKVTLKQMWLAQHKTLDEVIEMDYKIACTMLAHHDFFEGIRAAVIDKDKNPQWKPAHHDAVSDAGVDAYF